MMKLMFSVLLISANCVKINCDEESITTETVHEVSEKTELLSVDPEILESKTGSIETENEATNVTEDSKGVRVSETSTNSSPVKEAQFDLVSSKTHSAEVTFTEKSAPDDFIGETEVRTPDKEVTRRDNSAASIHENLEPLKIVEKQLELPKTSTFAPEIEDRTAKDPLEASAENKLSDIENTSSIKDETARNSEIEEIKEKSDESDSIEGLQTRRMLIPPDVLIDTKMRADTTTSSVKPEMKTALNQNLNTRNLKEFATDRNIKLINSSRAESSPIIETTTQPVNNKLASEELFNQQYIPKFYPQSELNIHFPNVNSDFQGPRDLPIHLRIKPDESQVRGEARPMQWAATGLQSTPDEYQSKKLFMGARNPHLKFTEENVYVNPRDEQHHHQSERIKSTEEKIYFNPRDEQHHQTQRMLDTSRTDVNKHFDYLPFDKRNPAPQFYQNHLTMDFNRFNQNNQSPYVNQNFGNRAQQTYPNSVPHFHQNRLQLDFKHFSQNIQSPGVNQDSKNLAQQFYQNPVPMNFESFTEKKQVVNLNQDSKNHIQPYPNPENTELNYKHLGNTNRDLKNHAHNNTQMPVNNNNLGNQYPLFRRPQGMIDARINIENKQFGNEPFANPYSYPHQPTPQQINVIHSPSRYNIIPPNIKILFQHLASASLYPTQLATNIIRKSRQIYPFHNNPNYKPNFSFYSFRHYPSI